MERHILDACCEIVDRVGETEAIAFHGAFGERAKEARSAGDVQLERVMRLLSGAFSMYSRDDPSRPFGPIAEFPDGTRTVVPEDLTEGELGDLEGLIYSSESPVFIARIADVLWIRRRNPAFARRAITAYLASAQVTGGDSWVPRSDSLRRAAQLACGLGRSAPERLVVREAVLGLFKESMGSCVSPEMGHWPAALAKILIENELLDEWTWLGDACEKIALNFPLTPGCNEPREYYELAAECYKLAKLPEQVERMRLAIADHWNAEAGAIRDAGGDALLISNRLQGAIEAFRRTRSGQEEVKRLTVYLKEVQRKATGELKTLSANVDVTKLVLEARARMANKSGHDAIIAFLHLHCPVSYESAREAAEKYLNEHPLQAIFTTNVLTPEGNVAATIPGAVDDASARLETGVIQQYNVCQNLAGAVLLEEARSIIQGGADVAWRVAIEGLIGEHPLIQSERSQLYSRAIFAGFEGDALVFLHLMIPQVEYLVREALHRAGVQTTLIDAVGIQEERDLNYLLRGEAAESILGKDLVWEMRCLLTEKSGPNLRNRLCHGLLRDSDFSQCHSTFLLWLALYLLVVTLSVGGNEPQGVEGRSESI